MHAQLLTHTPEPLRLIYAQARGTTTSRGFGAVYEEPSRFFPKAVRDALSLRFDIANFTPQEVLSGAPQQALAAAQAAEMARLVREAIDAGHLSVTRGVTFTFAISCSRSTGRQLLRHVVGVAWEEASQRYVKLLNRDYEERFKRLMFGAFGEPDNSEAEAASAEAELLRHAGQVFEVPAHVTQLPLADRQSWFWTRTVEMDQYLTEIESGAPAEDARENLPNCTRTRMISTWSFEALRTFLGKRLCTRAQAPIREIAKAMRKQALAVVPWAGPALGIQCTASGICPEAHPGSCPLLADQGGTILRKEQAQVAVREAARQLRGARSPAPGV